MVYLLLDRATKQVVGATSSFMYIRAHVLFIRAEGLDLESARTYLSALKRLELEREFIILPNRHRNRTSYQITVPPKPGDVVSSIRNGIITNRGRIATVCPALKTITTSTGMLFHRNDLESQWACGKHTLIRSD